MFFDPPFPLLVPPDPHIHFLLQEGEQVLPRPFLPHHCALQVCGTGVGTEGNRTAQARGPWGGASLTPAPLVLAPCAHLLAHSCLSP